jgi:hypothetical protein
MTDIERAEKIKENFEQCKARKERLTGSLDELKKQIRVQFDCNSLEEAKELQKKLALKKEKISIKLRAALKKYELMLSERAE